MKHASSDQNQTANDPLAFFLQLPYYTDYLDTIKTTEDTDTPADLTVYGLSDEQVSLIALDSLRQVEISQGSSGHKRPHSTDHLI